MKTATLIITAIYDDACSSLNGVERSIETALVNVAGSYGITSVQDVRSLSTTEIFNLLHCVEQHPNVATIKAITVEELADYMDLDHTPRFATFAKRAARHFGRVSDDEWEALREAINEEMFRDQG